MKKLLFLTLIIAFSSLLINADVYVKEKFHSDSYYSGGVTNPAVDKENEFWIGTNKMVSSDKDRMFILDKTKNLIFFVNIKAKTFVEAKLPLDSSQILDDQVKGILKTIAFKASVKESEETKKIKKWKCKGYDLAQWMLRGEEKFNESDTRLWVTSKVPFDTGLTSELLKNILKLISSEKELFVEYEKIKGFVIKTETTRYAEGNAIKSFREVVEITKKKPAKGVYSVPEGFTKKEKLSLQDLLLLLGN